MSINLTCPEIIDTYRSLVDQRAEDSIYKMRYVQGRNGTSQQYYIDMRRLVEDMRREEDAYNKNFKIDFNRFKFQKLAGASKTILDAHEGDHGRLYGTESYMINGIKLVDAYKHNLEVGIEAISKSDFQYKWNKSLNPQFDDVYEALQSLEKAKGWTMETGTCMAKTISGKKWCKENRLDGSNYTWKKLANLNIGTCDIEEKNGYDINKNYVNVKKACEAHNGTFTPACDKDTCAVDHYRKEKRRLENLRNKIRQSISSYSYSNNNKHYCVHDGHIFPNGKPNKAKCDNTTGAQWISRAEGLCLKKNPVDTWGITTGAKPNSKSSWRDRKYKYTEGLMWGGLRRFTEDSEGSMIADDVLTAECKEAGGEFLPHDVHKFMCVKKGAYQKTDCDGEDETFKTFSSLRNFRFLKTFWDKKRQSESDQIKEDMKDVFDEWNGWKTLQSFKAYRSGYCTKQPGRNKASNESKCTAVGGKFIKRKWELCALDEDLETEKDLIKRCDELKGRLIGNNTICILDDPSLCSKSGKMVTRNSITSMFKTTRTGFNKPLHKEYSDKIIDSQKQINKLNRKYHACLKKAAEAPPEPEPIVTEDEQPPETTLEAVETTPPAAQPEVEAVATTTAQPNVQQAS